MCTLYVYHYKPRFLETDSFLCKSSHTYPSFAFSDFQRPWILKSLSVIPNLHAAERQLCNENILLFTPSVAKADFTISLALVYDSFSFFFLRINVLDFFMNEIDLNKNMSESKSIPAREL